MADLRIFDGGHKLRPFEGTSGQMRCRNCLRVDPIPGSECSIGCPCGHGPDDICLNGLIYGNCGAEVCGGACVDIGSCESLPGCCNSG